MVEQSLVFHFLFFSSSIRHNYGLNMDHVAQLLEVLCFLVNFISPAMALLQINPVL